MIKEHNQSIHQKHMHMEQARITYNNTTTPYNNTKDD